MFVIFPTYVRTARRVMLAALTVTLGACSSFDQGTRYLADALTLYKPEVVQGNFVSREQVSALQAGMTRLQVRDILGTPLVTSLFHGDRWDYVFTLKRQGVEPQNYRLTLFFQGDVLERFEGDDMPSETEFASRISRERKVKVPELQATEAQLADFAAKAPDASQTEPPPAEPQPAGSYPPLEPSR